MPARRLAPPALLVLALAMPPSLTGCRPGAPATEEVVARLVTAAAEPPRSHVASTGEYAIRLPDAAGGAVAVTTTFTTERWVADAEHLRLESTYALAFGAEGDEASAAMIGPLWSAMGLDELRVVSVRNGDTVTSLTTPWNLYSTQDASAAAAAGPSAGAWADLVRTAVEELVAGYTVRGMPDGEVAGRRAFGLAVTPRRSGEAPPVLHVLRVHQAAIQVDAQTYEVLAIEGSGELDLTAGLRRMRAEGEAGPLGELAASLDGLQATAAPPSMPIHFFSRVTAFDTRPELPDALFALAPPPGATMLDLSALAGAAGAGDDQAAAAAMADAMATMMAGPMATAMADPAFDEAMAGAMAGGRAPSAAPAGAAPPSAEAAVAASTLASLGADASFALHAPRHVPAGCLALEAGQLPDAGPARLVWLDFECPDGALMRIEQKAAADLGLALDEVGAETRTVELDGRRLPYAVRADGGAAMGADLPDGTSVKVSGTLDPAELARVLEGLR